MDCWLLMDHSVLSENTGTLLSTQISHVHYFLLRPHAMLAFSASLHVLQWRFLHLTRERKDTGELVRTLVDSRMTSPMDVLVKDGVVWILDSDRYDICLLRFILIGFRKDILRYNESTGEFIDIFYNFTVNWIPARMSFIKSGTKLVVAVTLPCFDKWVHNIKGEGFHVIDVASGMPEGSVQTCVDGSNCQWYHDAFEVVTTYISYCNPFYI
jgi:hypothetical protein